MHTRCPRVLADALGSLAVNIQVLEERHGHYGFSGAERPALRVGDRTGGAEPYGRAGPGCYMAGSQPHRECPAGRALPQGPELAGLRPAGQPLRQPAPQPGHGAGGEGRHPHDELPGVAAGVLRNPEGGVHRGAPELPVLRRRDQVLPGAGGRGGPGLRPGVHRADGRHP